MTTTTCLMTPSTPVPLGLARRAPKPCIAIGWKMMKVNRVHLSRHLCLMSTLLVVLIIFMFCNRIAMFFKSESAVISKIKHGESNARIHKNVNRSRTNRDRDKDLPIDEGRVSSKKRKRSLAYEPPLASMKKLKSKRDIETNATESHDDVVSAFDSDEADRQFSGHAEGSKKKRKGKNSRIIVCSSEEEEDF